MTNVTYSTSNSIQMMSDVLTGLAGATVNINNQAGNALATFTLSTSPGTVAEDGSLVIYGSTQTIGSSGSGTVTSVTIGGIIRIPIAPNPVALVTYASSNNSFTFSGARVSPPVADENQPKQVV